MSGCTGHPISWLQLELYQLGELDHEARGAIASHLDGCPTCASCLESIAADHGRALPPLPVVAPRAAPHTSRRGRAVADRTPRWWTELRLSWVGLAAAGAAALLLVVLPRLSVDDAGERTVPAARVMTKGGEVALALVRERQGGVALDASIFSTGDRFKALVTCPYLEQGWWDLVVFQAGEAFFPLEAARLVGGNRRPLPGAFSLSGDATAVVCLVAASLHPPDREAMATSGPEDLEEGAVCVVVRPAPAAVPGAAPRE